VPYYVRPWGTQASKTTDRGRTFESVKRGTACVEDVKGKSEQMVLRPDRGKKKLRSFQEVRLPKYEQVK